MESEAQKMILKIYNLVANCELSSVGQIPTDALVLLSHIETESIKKAFAKEDLIKGKSYNQVVKKHGISKQQARTIKAAVNV